MPAFDLRDIKVAKYNNTSGAVTYSGGTSIGDAMSVDIQLKFAEGRLYAESTLAEYMKKCTGGTISIAEKYIPDAAQKTMFGMRDGTRSVTVDSKSVSVKSLKLGAKDAPNYVGVAFYAPDMVDGVEKFTAVLVTRALFGPPSMTLNTMGDSINFSTPTCSGEFMADHSSNQELIETATCDSEAEAQAWVNAVLSIS